MLRWASLTLVLFLLACSGQAVKAPVGDYSQRPRANPGYHKVRQGDTLFSIAFLYGYSVEEVASWNAINSPYTIYTGQQLRVSPPPPKAKPLKSSPKASQPKTSQPKTSQPKRGVPRYNQASAAAPRASQPKTSQPKASQPKTARPPQTAKAALETAPASGRLQAEKSASRALGNEPVIWSWPVEGRLIRTYNPTSAGKKGIDIGGKTGDPVRAAAAGKVVYSGSGLSGYGRLIILKHNRGFLSAYAHNRKLIAKEGQWVTKGEVIAQMGSSGTDRTQLHFEIRKAGRPVDPLRYLPKR
jgi:lipoprotein NlpD